MKPPYVIGVDGGTEGIRAGVFDSEGRALAFSSCPYKTSFPRPGWAQQVQPTFDRVTCHLTCNEVQYAACDQTPLLQQIRYDGIWLCFRDWTKCILRQYERFHIN